MINNPIQTIENNFFGTHYVLEFAKKYNKRTFIFSTSEVYGKSEEFPFQEENDLVLGGSHKPRWGYACSKLLDEFLGRAYFYEHGTPVTVIRLFNTIGRRQVGSYGMVVPRFFDQAFRGESLTVYGEGIQRRCFTDVRDVVEVLVDLIDIKESYGEAVNIGRSQEVSIIELAKKIRSLVGTDVPIANLSFKSVYGDRFEDMNRRVPCTEKLGRLIGRNLRYTLDETLAWIHGEFQQKYAQSGSVVLEKNSCGVG